ncbi:adenylate kinase [Rothia mucilaginosa]|uniref:adenylate kinase n=1 Tax=Rothia mucilaginosa TaxID=43675 RepID=UPI00066E5851|nr:adenylate kinase [Rothia mucilaginosa]
MRILIAGPSGSGKTTFAARLGRLLDIPHTEMDSLHWGPNWTPRPSFEADVQTLIERPAWITEWQYPQVRGRLLERADVVIYLRYSRAVTGQRLWADNVEPPLKNILRDPDNMIRYTWRSYPHVGELLAEARGQHLQKRFLEFRTPRAANQFLRAVQLRGVL